MGFVLLATTSRLTLRPPQPPIHCVPRALFLRVKQSGHEADHSHPSNAEVKNAWIYISIPPICLHVMMLN